MGKKIQPAKDKREPLATRVTVERVAAATTLGAVRQLEIDMESYDWRAEALPPSPARFMPPKALWAQLAKAHVPAEAEKAFRDYALRNVCQRWGAERFLVARGVVRSRQLRPVLVTLYADVDRLTVDIREDSAAVRKMLSDVNSMRARLAQGAAFLDEDLPPLDDALARVATELELAAAAFHAAWPDESGGRTKTDERRKLTEIVCLVRERLPDLPSSPTTWAVFAIAVELDGLPKDAVQFQDKHRKRWADALNRKIGNPH